MSRRGGPFRRVVNSEVYSTPKSILLPWHLLGWAWTLTLECGHEVYRKARYVPERQSASRRSWGGHYRHYDDIIQKPPQRVRCEQCGRKL